MADTTKKVEKQNNSKEVVINLDTFAIPIAIVIAGVIIALGIFFANKNSKASNNVAGTNDTSTTSDSGSTFTSATTNIDDGAYLGNKDTATVAIVMYSDYQCPYCQSFEEQTLGQIKTDYIDNGKVIFVFRNYPLSFHGDITYQSAYAGECVKAQLGNEKFAEFHSKAYLASSMDDVNKIAQDLGVNMDTYNKCVSDKTYKSVVDTDFQAGQDAGVTGTPGFIVGKLSSDGTVTGKLVEGAYPYDTFKSLLDSMLSE